MELVLAKPVESTVFEKIYRELLREHGLLILQLSGAQPVVRIVEYRATPSKLARYKWLLTAITIVTVFFTGLGLSESLEELQHIVGRDVLYLDKYSAAALYTVLFLLVMLSHELGHVYVNRRIGVQHEGPILIPAPPIQLGFIGTFGAVIFTKTPPCSRRDLAKIGISGPLAGFVTGTVVGILGLYLSPVVPLEVAKVLAERGYERIPVSMPALELLLRLRPIEGVLVMHPLLFITYVIYIVTFLNLLPIGQLDGGHVLRSFTSMRAHRYIGLAVPVILLFTGLAFTYLYNTGYFYLGLGVLTTILWLTVGKTPHLGVANWYDKSRCAYCLVLYTVLLVLTTPLPLF